MRTVFWENDRLHLIDQRLLPDEFTVASFDTVEEVAAAITQMYVRGAPAIGATAAYGMALAARNSKASDVEELLGDLEEARSTLDNARPTAVNLSWATRRMIEKARQYDSADKIRSALLEEAERIADQDVEVNRRMGFHGAELVKSGANVLTHCNTGALATVDFGTALGVVFACREQGKPVHVWVDETRPRLQGARLTAWELMQAEIPMHLIVDGAAGHLMRTGKVDIVLFGADRVAANGDVANKIGSYPLAVLAHENKIPVYCVAPTSTIDLSLADGDAIPIEERDGSEVLSLGHAGSKVSSALVPVLNLAFDVTPHHYFSGIVTEEGVCYPPFTDSLKEAVEKARERSNL